MALPPVQLKTTAGEPLPIIDYIRTQVCIPNMESSVQQNFVVVSSLIAPVILGPDFFQQHGLILDLLLLMLRSIPKMCYIGHLNV